MINLITPFFWFLIIAGVFSSFSFWRRLKDDFKDSEIFEMTLEAFGLAIVLARLVFILLNFQTFGLSFSNWLALNSGSNFSPVGAFLGAILAINHRMLSVKKNLWEVLDALALPFMYFLLLGGIGYLLTTWNLFNLVYIGLGLVGVGLFPLIRKNYRSLVWYKSGKTGFLFSVYGIYVSLGLLVLAFFRTDSLYLNRLLLVITFCLSLVVLYHRSERSFGRKK